MKWRSWRSKRNHSSGSFSLAASMNQTTQLISFDGKETLCKASGSRGIENNCDIVAIVRPRYDCAGNGRHSTESDSFVDHLCGLKVDVNVSNGLHLWLRWLNPVLWLDVAENTDLCFQAEEWQSDSDLNSRNMRNEERTMAAIGLRCRNHRNCIIIFKAFRIYNESAGSHYTVANAILVRGTPSNARTHCISGRLIFKLSATRSNRFSFMFLILKFILRFSRTLGWNVSLAGRRFPPLPSAFNFSQRSGRSCAHNNKWIIIFSSVFAVRHALHSMYGVRIARTQPSPSPSVCYLRVCSADSYACTVQVKHTKEVHCLR